MRKIIYILGMLVLLVGCNQEKTIVRQEDCPYDITYTENGSCVYSDTLNVSEETTTLELEENITGSFIMEENNESFIIEGYNSSSGTLFMIARTKKNVTALCSSDNESFCFYSNNLSMPDYLVPLGNDAYAFKLPIKQIVEIYVYP